MRAVLAVAAMLTVATAAAAQGPTRDDLLASVYPGAAIRGEQVFLTPEQQRRAAELGKVEVPSALIARYIATRNGAVVGRAYVDTHTVRTKRESLLIALDADGALQRIEVTAFLEPPEFEASALWLRQYRDRSLTDGLAVNRDIRPLAGATLTTRAVNTAARRVLAVDAVLREGGRP